MRSAYILILFTAGPALADQKPKGLPVTGEPQPKLADVDKLLLDYLAVEKSPGATVAVAKDGRLVYARGFGYADPDHKTPMQPMSLIRIASVSKAITTAAICQLVERGKITADDKVLDILKLKEPANLDPRWKKITVLHLIAHAGGFDRDSSGDPMFMSIEIAKSLKIAAPPKQDQIIRYVLARPLDYEPGTKMVYSNFGYCLLGRVIEKVSGKSYEQYVTDELLKPIGIREMKLGKTLTTAKGEVRYTDADQPTGPSAFASLGGRNVPSPYGAWCLEAMDSHGGWIASSVELVRFGSAIDFPERFPAYKGMAFKYRFCPEYIHFGAINGSSAMLHRQPNGVVYSVMFNARRSRLGEELCQDMHERLKKVLAKVESWPEGDLFSQYLK